MFLAALLFGSLLLSPFLHIIPGLPAFRPDEAIALLILSTSIFRIGSTSDAWMQGLKLAWPLLGLAFAMVMTSFYAAVAKHVSFTPRDLMEVFFPIKYTVFILAGSIVGAAISEKKIDRLAFWILVFGLIAALVGLLQFVKVDFVLKKISPLFVPELARAHLSSMESGGRVIGTTGNANHYAAVLGFVMLVAAAKFGISPHKKILPIMVCIIASIVAIVTISRVNYVAIPVALAIIFFSASLHQKSLSAFFKLGLAIGVLAVVASLFFSFAAGEFRKRSTSDVSAFDRRVESLTDYSERGTISTRIKHFTRKLQWLNESPIFGVGASKSGPSIGGDNEYVSTLAKYGLFGFSMLFVFYTKTFFTMRRCVGACSGYFKLFPLVVMAFIAQILIGNLTGGAFYQGQVFGLLAFTSGIACAGKYNSMRPDKNNLVQQP